jgi:hypothetical protein
MTPKEAVDSLVNKLKDHHVYEFKHELKALKELLDYYNYAEIDINGKSTVIQNVYFENGQVRIKFKTDSEYYGRVISFLIDLLDEKIFHEHRLKCAQINLIGNEREIQIYESGLARLKQQRSKFKREIKKLEKINESPSST